MLILPNYKIDSQIYESANSLIYRGYRNNDNQPVILKMLKQDYPSPTELNRYQQEVEITSNLDSNGIIKTYDIEKYQNTLVIILEDFDGNSLKQLMLERVFNLKDFFSFAIQLAEGLGNIHAANVIHKDINPSNIVWEPITKQVKIIDFGIASRLSREIPTLSNPEQLEGTLAYISPEQTGRINRSIDYRTDLYSLGVTFYELLCGRLPFTTKDTMELIHCHIAKIPIPPCEINPEIPPIVSDIIMKLLAKNAEDRYQSAFGVKADLEKIQENLTGLEDMACLSFDLAQKDFSGQFQIPQKLYGRDNEVDILLQAFERVSDGKTEMMLVAGYSGVGKTAIVHEVHKPMTKKKGYFAAGKFDQLQKDIPYSAITQAFNEFCHYLLTENTELLANWRNKILDAVGNNGQIIIDVVPDLELVIGKQPTVVEVGPTEAQNRFQIFFLNFVKALCDKKHPFILFIDDLQWIDSASLSLLKNIMLDDQILHLLIIGAYRDNEVDSSHPFIMVVEELQKANAIVNHIELSNLQLSDINHLLQDTLQCKTSQTLADLVYQKTQGNAFFTHHFLHTLYKEELLSFKQQQWQWDVKQITAQNITDNVVELMANKIDKLPEKTSMILQLAACIGNQFDLSTLNIISEQNETISILRPAIEEELVQPLDENYKHLDTAEKSQFKFLHDRVQQAAYALIDDNQKKAVHLKIGRLLLANLSPEEWDNEIFKIVDHFNIAWTLITNVQEKLQLAELNLQATKKAKFATAYKPAEKYLAISIKLLPKNAWQLEYNLTYRIYFACAEIALLNKNYQRAEKYYSILLKKAQTSLEKAQVYVIQIEQYQLFGKLTEVLSTGKKALKLLDIYIPDSSEQLHVFIANESRQIDIDNLTIENKLTSDPQIITTTKIINSTMMSAFFAGEQLLHGALAYKQTNLSLKYGNTRFSPVGYASLGFFMASALNKIQEGVKFGKLGMKLIEQFDDKSISCRTMMFYHIFWSHWHTHLKYLPTEFEKAFHNGLDSGDIAFAGFNLMWKTSTRFFRGENLQKVYTEALDTMNYMAKTNNFVRDIFKIGIIQATLHLQGQTLDNKTLSTVNFNEEETWKQFGKIPIFAGWLYATKIRSLYFFEYYEELLDIYPQFQLANAILATHQNFTVELYLYNALAITAVYENSVKKELYLQRLKEFIAKMKAWADIYPPNYSQQYLIVKAEFARISNEEIGRVMHLYDLAIQTAKENEYIQFEALGNELAGKFWLSQAKEEFSNVYLLKAHYLYKLWGANAKVSELEAKYPQLLTVAKTFVPNITATINTLMTSVSTKLQTSTILDLDSITKASHTLAGEIVLSKLLEKMMHIVIENAGAERGLLILGKGESKWVIEAEGKLGVDEITILQSIPVEGHLPIPIVNYVVRTREPVVLMNAMQEGIYTKDSYIQQYRLKSILCSPILHQGKLIGLLYLENNLIEGAFTEARLKMINMFSSQAAISLENSLLYKTLEDKVEQRTGQLATANQEITYLNEQLKQENMRMGAELDIAKQLQHMVLPKETELQQIDNLDIAGFMEPAEEVGGDYYEVLNHDGHIKIGIGDVTGHGLESGVLMLMVQTTVRALLLAGIDNPETFLNIVNRTVYHNAQRMETDKNLTLSLLDYKNGTLQLTGQHEEILLVRKNGKVELIDTFDLGFMVGVVDDIAEFSSHQEITLQAGDGIVLYTDGITEAQNIENKQYSLERLCNVVSGNWLGSSLEVQQAVVADVKDYIGEKKVIDDITLLVLKQE
ncbi:AAA family ATPase [Thiotrichales bacterium HSG1]|nr:AAA family ATPase [Thiotrichales bacterium HSG1]